MNQPRLLGGRYELDGVIGRGGMAEVYRARDIRLDRQVAIKTLRSDLARDPTFQARFRREAQSAASLNHPSVIAVYDTGEDVIGGTPIPYIVMEYVDGQTLRDILHDSRKLRPDRAMEIVDGILRALDYSHRGGIVHRDIKPANVMMTQNGDVKVMDFGIARAMADTAATMTATAQVIGTAQYLSPEQARGERVDTRSDLYSTGCVLYELLTGNPPFTGDSPVAIAYQHVREDPVPPSQVDPQIPHWADAIVLKAMAKSPDDRYQDAAEMRADIQRALQGMPVEAATALMSPTQRMAGPPPTQMQRAATGYDLPPVRGYDDMDRRDGKGKKAALWILGGLLLIGAAALIGYLLVGGNQPTTDQVAVPDVVGQTRDSAEDELTEAGLKVQVKNEFSKETKGNVFKTQPEPGTQVNPGTLVTLHVSRGRQEVTVPPLVGQSREDAERALEQRGLEVGSVDTRNSTRPRDTVISSRPASGEEVPAGSEVDLVVSEGGSKVPDVVNLSREDAEDAVDEAGFRPVIRFVDSPGDPPDTVIRQSPSAGTTLARGANVTIFVARQPEAPPPTSPPTSPPITEPPG
jgi:beta-lactam-binding protein with PASTA domain/tRNA A-37 threonylcarbamoyl transferase component Bud32